MFKLVHFGRKRGMQIFTLGVELLKECSFNFKRLFILCLR